MLWIKIKFFLIEHKVITYLICLRHLINQQWLGGTNDNKSLRDLIIRAYWVLFLMVDGRNEIQ